MACVAVWLCVCKKRLQCTAVADTKWGQGGTAHALGTASVVASEPKTAPPSAVTFLVTGQKFSATVYSQMFHRISSHIQYLEPEITNELTFPNFSRHIFVCTCPGACFHQAHSLCFLRKAGSSNCSDPSLMVQNFTM